MPFTLSDIALGVFLPAIAGCALFCIMSRGVSGTRGEPLVAPLTVALSYAAGYGLLRPGPLVPEKQWHWLPVIGLMAALCEFPVLMRKSPVGLRWLLWCGMAVAAGFLVTPERDSLRPPRMVWLVTWPALAVVTAWAADASFRRRGVHRVALVTCIVFFSACVVNLLSGSLRFSQLALPGLASGLSMGLAVWCSPRSSRADLCAFVVSLLLCGVLLTGRVNASMGIPLLSYLLIPGALIGLSVSDRWRHRESALPGPLKSERIPARSEAVSAQTGSSTWLQAVSDVCVVGGCCLTAMGLAMWYYFQ